MDDTELFAIWQEAGSPKNARRALFEAGRRAEREGTDTIVDDDLNDTILSFNHDYSIAQGMER